MDNLDGTLFQAKALALSAMKAYMGEMVDFVQADLATPWPPSSTPHTSPHLRTGNLQAGVSSEATADADSIAGSMKSERADGDPKVPSILNYGIGMDPRPFWDKARLKMYGEAAGRINQLIRR